MTDKVALLGAALAVLPALSAAQEPAVEQLKRAAGTGKESVMEIPAIEAWARPMEDVPSPATDLPSPGALRFTIEPSGDHQAPQRHIRSVLRMLKNAGLEIDDVRIDAVAPNGNPLAATVEYHPALVVSPAVENAAKWDHFKIAPPALFSRHTGVGPSADKVSEIIETLKAADRLILAVAVSPENDAAPRGNFLGVSIRHISRWDYERLKPQALMWAITRDHGRRLAPSTTAAGAAESCALEVPGTPAMFTLFSDAPVRAATVGWFGSSEPKEHWHLDRSRCNWKCKSLGCDPDNGACYLDDSETRCRNG